MRKNIALLIAFVIVFGLITSCGMSSVELANTYKGSYFEISYPDNFTIETQSNGGLKIKKNFIVEVNTQQLDESRKGEAKSILKTLNDLNDKAKDDGATITIEEREINGFSGNWISWDSKEGKVFAFLVPDDRQFVFASVDQKIPLKKQEDIDTAKAIIESFKPILESQSKIIDESDQSIDSKDETKSDGVYFENEAFSLTYPKGWTVEQYPKSNYVVLKKDKKQISVSVLVGSGKSRKDMISSAKQVFTGNAVGKDALPSFQKSGASAPKQNKIIKEKEVRYGSYSYILLLVKPEQGVTLNQLVGEQGMKLLFVNVIGEMDKTDEKTIASIEYK